MHSYGTDLRPYIIERPAVLALCFRYKYRVCTREAEVHSCACSDPSFAELTVLKKIK